MWTQNEKSVSDQSKLEKFRVRRITSTLTHVATSAVRVSYSFERSEQKLAYRQISLSRDVLNHWNVDFTK